LFGVPGGGFLVGGLPWGFGDRTRGFSCGTNRASKRICPTKPYKTNDFVVVSNILRHINFLPPKNFCEGKSIQFFKIQISKISIGGLETIN